jgi:hypothetical protein
MKEKLTITSFYEKYRDEIPFSLPILRRYIKENFNKLPAGVIVTIKGNKRNTYKVLEPKKLLSFIKGL